MNPYGLLMRLLFIVMKTGSDSRQPYYDFARFLQEREDVPACEKGIPVRELPPDCQESATTPTELFSRLDEWGYPYLVIPHGSSWGFYTPPLSSWDKQLAAHTNPDRHEPLIEVFSGHGNIEQYRSWHALAVDEPLPPDGEAFFFMATRTREMEEAEWNYETLKELNDSPNNGNADIYWVGAGFFRILKEKSQF